jgi:hypothetical protein
VRAPAGRPAPFATWVHIRASSTCCDVRFLRPLCRSAATRLGWPVRRTFRWRGCEADHHAGEAAGARIGGVFAEGHVADVVQLVLDRPVPAKVAGQLRGAGGAQGQAGDGVSTRATLCLNPAASRGTSTAADRRASQRWAMVARPGASCSVVTISRSPPTSPACRPCLGVWTAGRRRGITPNG